MICSVLPCTAPIITFNRWFAPVAPRFRPMWSGRSVKAVIFWVRTRILPLPKSGELLAVMSAGAYGFSMASNYNSRPRAAEIMVQGEGISGYPETGDLCPNDGLGKNSGIFKIEIVQRLKKYRFEV